MAISKITENGLTITDLTVADDLTVSDDLLLASDGAIIKFGVDGEVSLSHDADDGLILKANSGDASGPKFYIKTAETTVVADDVIGSVQFQAPDEASGGDAVFLTGMIKSVATATFDASNNPAALTFHTSTSEHATEKMRITPAGGIQTNPTSGGNTIINEGGVDADFRIEGATSTHALFVKGDDSNIGIGTDTPDRMGSSNSRGVVTISSNSYAVLELVDGSSDGDGNLNTLNFVFTNNTAANNGQVVLLRGYTDGTQAGHRGGRFSIFTKNNNATGLNEHFRIDKAGNITATDTSIGSISDERLKTNMEDFTYSIDDFKKYKPKKYDWKHPEVHGGKSGQWGFSAQDVEKIDTRFVDEYLVHDTEGIKDEEGNQIVHPDKQYLDADDIAKSSKLQQKDAMYISVIQQLIARIETLESK